MIKSLMAPAWTPSFYGVLLGKLSCAKAGLNKREKERVRANVIGLANITNGLFRS